MKAASPARHRKTNGFTLIELLIVIAIIAILVGLLFPAFAAVRESVRKTQAHNDITQLIVAVKAYKNEYGQYPLNANNALAGAEGTDTVYGDPNGLYSSADLCDILRAIPDNRFNQNNQLNTRQVVYFQGQNATSLTSPVSGFAQQNATAPEGNIKQGAYMDPWGNEYVVFIDANNDGNVTEALAWFYYVNTPQVNAGVAACSLGKDHTWGKGGNGNFTGSDDIGSW